MASCLPMATFNTALRGTSWALASQVAIAAGQIAYAALTARVFSPYAFGEFTAALSLFSLIAVCTGTGLSSFVLKEAHIRRSQLRAIYVAVFSVALLGTAVYWFVSPIWLAWLNSPGGTQFVPLLTWATFVTPFGAIQSALLRREGNGRADAVAFVLAFVVANSIAALCVILIRESWTLALATAVNPMILAVLSRVMRRAVYPVEPSMPSSDWLFYALRVAGQNLVFFGIALTPTWTLGASVGPATLGQFSRANMLTALPAGGLSTAIVRGTQTHWRKVETGESRVRAVAEALLLGASGAFVVFAVLAVLSHPLTNLLLGPGWDLAAELTVWLAIGFGLQVPTYLLANYLEMTAELSRVRWIQVASIVSLAVGVALFTWLHDLRWLMGGFVLSNLAGLIAAVLQVSAALDVGSGHLFKQLIAPLITAVGAAGAAFGAAGIVKLGLGAGTPVGDAAQVVGGGLAVIAFAFFTRKWHPAFSILVARGVLKRA